MNVENKTIYYSNNLDILRNIDSHTIDLIYLDPPFNKRDTFIAKGDAKKKIEKIKQWYIRLQKELGIFADKDFNEIFKDNVKFKDIWIDTDIQKENYAQLDHFNHEILTYLDSIRKSAVSGTFFYLIFMTIRLIEMYRILKDTGSIYLHCDPTMSHYLKIIMDKIFGSNEDYYRNEIIWAYKFGGSSKVRFSKKHDVILYYSKTDKPTFNEHLLREFETKSNWGQREDGKLFTDWWYIPQINTMAKERTGYPTQKPLSLLERIVKASSNEHDVVLDPFCGCATTCVAAEKLGRQWVGIDWSQQAYYMVFYRLNQEGIGGTESRKSEVIERAGEKIKISSSDKLQYLYDAIKLKEEPPKLSRKDNTLFYYPKKSSELKVTYKSESTETSLERMTPQYKKEAMERLYAEQVGMCNGCDVYFSSVNLTIDHISPKSRGGTNHLDNLQLLCYRCNNWKRDKTMEHLIHMLYEKEVISLGTFNKQIEKYRITAHTDVLM